MKVRNGGRWTREERIQLWHHLRQVASLSPYLIVLLTQGSMVLLPVVAWWLDRRRVLRGHLRLKTERLETTRNLKKRRARLIPVALPLT